MKHKFLATLAIAAFLFGIAGAAQALTVTSIVGDKDGYGLGVNPGEFLDWTSVGSGDGDGTDVWFHGPQSWTHTYDISSIADIDSISLEIVTAGTGTTGITGQIYLYSTYIGDVSGGSNYSYLNTYDLIAYESLFDGSDTLTITVSSGDGWAMDYSELEFSGSPVPEPTTIFLLGSGLIGIAGFRRKIKK